MVIEVIIAITVFVMYTVPEVKDKFLRSTPENILRSAIIRYMDNSDLKQWMDFIQQEVGYHCYFFIFLSFFVTAASQIIFR